MGAFQINAGMEQIVIFIFSEVSGFESLPE
jgi:hypothetical protein